MRCRAALLLSSPIVLGLLLNVVAAQDAELKYAWKPQQAFAYRIKVTVELPEKVETYQGTTSYTVKSVEGEGASVTYQGGLPKTVKETVVDRPRGFRVPGPPPSPFSRNNFRGSDITTNDITLSPTGKVVKMKGDSQLPYLLGNVSLLPFEPLPEGGLREWKVQGGTSITEKEERTDGRFPRFGFDPFGRGQQEEETQSASESTTYKVTGVEGEIVSVAKTYELKSPPPKADEDGFTLSGNGTWKFNRKLHVPESLRMSQKLVVAGRNRQVTIPISIEFDRLSDEELAKLNAERQKAMDDLRRKHEERMQAEAEKKKKSEEPLTADQKKAARTALAGNDAATRATTLAELAEKNPLATDAEIAAALETLLKNKERPVREAAHKALLKWSLAYRPREELDKQYASVHGVASTAKSVPADAPLYVGQILQLKDNSRWVPVDVLELLADGRVKVHPRGWSTDAWDKPVGRENLQFAPDELFQPAKSPDDAAVSASSTGAVAMRTWTDSTGTHKIEAVYLGVEEGKIKMKRKDGKEIKVPLASMSKEDQTYVEQMQKAVKTPPNPFE